MELMKPMYVIFFCLAPALSVVAEELKTSDNFQVKRDRLISEIEQMGVKDDRVLAALRRVPRHEFIPDEYRQLAYNNHPVPIGSEQTISQPYIVAFMTAALQLRPGHKVLEVGTGSGYQAAILAELAGEVFSIEIVEALGRQAQTMLRRLGYKNIHLRIGDGYRGWPEAAPFDSIIVTAAAPRPPAPLINQLKDGGVMVIPLGTGFQNLVLIKRLGKRITQKPLLPVVFVPMTGEVRKESAAPPNGIIYDKAAAGEDQR